MSQYFNEWGQEVTNEVRAKLKAVDRDKEVDGLKAELESIKAVHDEALKVKDAEIATLNAEVSASGLNVEFWSAKFIDSAKEVSALKAELETAKTELSVLKTVKEEPIK